MKRWLAAAATLLLPGMLWAQAPVLPEGVREIGTEELKQKIDAGEKLVLINSLSALEFTQSKIKGSVNIPYGHLRDGEDKLPPDQGATLVFYCLGPK